MKLKKEGEMAGWLFFYLLIFNTLFNGKNVYSKNGYNNINLSFTSLKITKLLLKLDSKKLLSLLNNVCRQSWKLASPTFIIFGTSM